MRRRVRVSISDAILTYPPEKFEQWFTTTTLPGVWTDYYPKPQKPKPTTEARKPSKVKKPKKVEEGGS